MAAERSVLLVEDDDALRDNVVHLFAVREAADDPLTIPFPPHAARRVPRPCLSSVTRKD